MRQNDFSPVPARYQNTSLPRKSPFAVDLSGLAKESTTPKHHQVMAGFRGVPLKKTSTRLHGLVYLSLYHHRGIRCVFPDKGLAGLFCAPVTLLEWRFTFGSFRAASTMSS